MQLSAAQTNVTLETADRALGLLAAAFPASALCVLRVPSPAALYAFADADVSVQAERGAASYSADSIRARSDALGARVHEIAGRHGALYVDAAPALRAAAASDLIHGPRDWRHLNRRGQTVLGEVAAQCLAAMADQPDPQSSRRRVSTSHSSHAATFAGSCGSGLVSRVRSRRSASCVSFRS
jgi:hypothetical protein